MKKLFLLLCFLSTSIFSQVLPVNSLERQQLIAMGAEVLPEKKDDTYTIFRLGGDLFFISKIQEKITIGRNFTKEKILNATEELELYKIVNKINVDQPFQFVVFEKSVQANAYIFGNHDPKVFALIVLTLAKFESYFDANPKIFKLVNN
jgi:hypothetical protein